MLSIRKTLEKIKTYRTHRRHTRFSNLFNLPPAGEILDISCGDGDFLQAIRSYYPETNLHGVDISAEAIEIARKECPFASFQQASAESLPFSEAKFDVILSCMSLHHYQNAEQVFSEVARVLVPGGRFFIIDLFPLNRLTQALHNYDGCPEPYHFEKYYRRPEIVLLGKNSGLYVSRIRRLSIANRQKVIVLQKK